MFIRHLSLANFRNYTSLELDLPEHLAVFQGDNAHGKSNLLEAIYILATSRSPRANNERELINWSALETALPVCRLAADAERAGRKLRLEVAIRGKAPGEALESYPTGRAVTGASTVQKRIRINGAPKRAADLIGQINVVPFSAQDINIIGGEPALRRRYLDITNSQVDNHYLRQLQRYQRILWQRNRLLRLIAEHRSSPDELLYWDGEMVQTGTYIMVQRENTVDELNNLAQDIHSELSGGQGRLSLMYNRSLDRENSEGGAGIEEIADLFSRALNSIRGKEIAQGISLIGPHRDELRFLADKVDLGIYGSRGQQRTAALSLKLAEARFILVKTEDHPILLLDDVLSELDSRRRSHLLQAVSQYRQVLMTTTDLDYYEPDFLKQAELYRVKQGCVEPLQI